MSPVHSPTKSPSETQKPPQPILLAKSELIAGYLQNLALPSLGNRQLSQKDYEVWGSLLEAYSKEAIAYAFESWVRNNTSAGKFPHPPVIIKLAESYQQQETDAKKFHGCGRCYDGWLYSRDDPRRYRLGVKRCPCFTTWLEQNRVA